jgi:hypothetical protein
VIDNQSESLGQLVRNMGDQARVLAGRIEERLELERRIEEQPWMVLGTAAAAGFVLGGGLWPMLRPVVRGAARALITPGNVLALMAAVTASRAGELGGTANPSPEA